MTEMFLPLDLYQFEEVLLFSGTSSEQYWFSDKTDVFVCSAELRGAEQTQNGFDSTEHYSSFPQEQASG